MRRFPAKHTPDRNQRVILPSRREFFRSQRQFECSRNAHDINILAARAHALQCIHRRRQEPLSYETIEAANDDAKAKTRGGQFAANLPGL